MLRADNGVHVAPGESVTMTVPAPLTIDLGPEWMVGEMPPGYGTRLAEIQRLTAELHGMSRLGRLLYEVGPRLGDAVGDMFAGLGFATEVLAESGGTALAVRVDNWNRLLLHVSSDDQPIQRKSPEIARVFQLLHEIAEDHDRVALVTNSEPAVRPADRRDPLTHEARDFLNRLSATHVTATTLFGVWKLSLEDTERAREQVQKLQRHPGGTFELPASARL
jgi:hypothetical protein